MAKKNSNKVSANVVVDVPIVDDVVDIPSEVPDVPVSEEVTVPVTSEVDDDIPLKFEKLLKNMNVMLNTIKESQVSLKNMQKEYTKMMKTVNKKTRKSTNTTKRAPSGFAKPTYLSDEICEFLNIEKGTMLARTEVTRMINQYIKTNNLQFEKDRRRIIPDQALREIIQSKDEDIVTYFNLQSYIKHHFKEKVV